MVTRYYLGLDLGQSQDYTALAVCRREWERRDDGDGPASYQLLALRRWPLGTSYPAIVADVGRILARPDLSPPAPLFALDFTGCGRPVWDMFRAARIAATGIAITGGNEVIQAAALEWHVPKRDLVSVVQVLLQDRRLQWPASLPEGETLARELQTFRVKISLAGNDTFEAWRERDHDDCVLAVALACWAGETLKLRRWSIGGLAD